MRVKAAEPDSRALTRSEGLDMYQTRCMCMGLLINRRLKSNWSVWLQSLHLPDIEDQLRRYNGVV